METRIWPMEGITIFAIGLGVPVLGIPLELSQLILLEGYGNTSSHFIARHANILFEDDARVVKIVGTIGPSRRVTDIYWNCFGKLGLYSEVGLLKGSFSI